MKKNLLIRLIGIIIVFVILVVSRVMLAKNENKTKTASGNVVENTEVVSKGNHKITECVDLLNTDQTVEEMNEVMGFEAEVNEESNKWTWKFDDKNYITVSGTSSSKSISATIQKSTIKDENVDLSTFSEMSAELKSGNSYTYEELVAKVGGVEGTLVGKTTSSKRYNWVDKHNRTFSATISDRTGKASIITMR